MQNLCKKDSDLSFPNSTAPPVLGCPSLWTSTESQMQQSSLSNNLSLKMATPNQQCQTERQLGFHFQEQDSSSTQSTGQSYSEVASVDESNQYGQSIMSMQSGYNEESHVKSEGEHIKLDSLMGTQEHVVPSAQVDYRQSFSCFPLSYPDQYFGGLLAAYGPQTMIHQYPQMMGMAAARVPLPLDLPQNEPIYVNAKQYHAILRRRQFRAKLEAQNKLSKVRKPYLHESRHLHALKRARGSGGRFLNMKQLQLQESKNVSGVGQLHLTSTTASTMSESVVHRPENHKGGGVSTTTSSDITSASNCDVFRQQEFHFTLYPPRAAGTAQGGGGDDMYLSVFR